jgi:hypothetical protein
VNLNLILNVNVKAMDFRHRKQELLERAKYTEEEASRVKNAQAQDVMRALALLYREMAEELEDRGLFERRLFPLDFVDLAALPLY